MTHYRRAGRRCTVCSHESLTTIQKLMANGEPLSALSFQFDLAKSSLPRHSKNCMGRTARPYAKANRLPGTSSPKGGGD
jgi:hypothetical protein